MEQRSLLPGLGYTKRKTPLSRKDSRNPGTVVDYSTMPTGRRTPPDEPLHQPTEEEFEELVAAALKVDPKGLSGKHRKRAKVDSHVSVACRMDDHGACDQRVIVPCECACHEGP